MPQQDIQTVIKDPKFLALDGDSQVQVLQHMRSLQPAAAPTSQSTGTPPPPPDPDDTPGAIGATVDVLKNVGKRVYEYGKGMVQSTLTPPRDTGETIAATVPGGLPMYRQSVAAVKGAGTAFKQAYQQGKEAVADASTPGNDPVVTGLKFARAGVTGASALNPLATGSVTDINTLEDQGKNREAIGTGITDALLLALGGRRSKGSAAEGKQNAFTASIGETAKTPQALHEIMPDVERVAAKQGLYDGTIGGTLKSLEATSKDLGALPDAELSLTNPQPGSIAPQRVPGYGPGSVTGTPTRAQMVANAPGQSKLANTLLRMGWGPEASNLEHTAAGSTKRAMVVDAINEYVNKPWTYGEMAQEVKTLRQKLNAYQTASSNEARRMVMSDMDLQVTKAVVKGFNEEINNALQTKYPMMPPDYFNTQRQKQAIVLDASEALEEKVKKLGYKQANFDAQDITDRLKPHAYLAGGGARAHISGFSEAMGSGPMAEANKFVRKSRGGLPTRAALLALPMAHLAELPPPPQDSDNQ